jgi:hypothetical protein
MFISPVVVQTLTLLVVPRNSNPIPARCVMDFVVGCWLLVFAGFGFILITMLPNHYSIGFILGRHFP